MICFLSSDEYNAAELLDHESAEDIRAGEPHAT